MPRRALFTFCSYQRALLIRQGPPAGGRPPRFFFTGGIPLMLMKHFLKLIQALTESKLINYDYLLQKKLTVFFSECFCRFFHARRAKKFA